MSNEYPKEWIDLLTHMTGSHRRQGQGYRNYAAASEGWGTDRQKQRGAS